MIRNLTLILFASLACRMPAAFAMSVESLDASLTDGVYRISLQARLDAPVNRVADVLTDYPGYRRLDPDIRLSEVVDSPDGSTPLVRTRVRACAGWFCRNVERVERVDRGDHELVATVLPERSDLRSGVTRTTWQADGETTRITYHAEFVPGFWVPGFIGRHFAVDALKESTLAIFGNVEKRARGG
jgi:hypothetical protein